MRQRIITGIIMILVLGPTIFIGGPVFNGVIAFLCIVGITEILRMAKIDRTTFPSIITYIALLSIIFNDQLSSYIPSQLNQAFVPLLSIMVLLVSTVLIESYQFTKAATSVLAMFYLGLGGYAAIRIRGENFPLLIFILIVVFSTDIGAYFIGSKIGKNKLAPKLSPNKTIEGAVGGVLLSFILAALYLNFFTFHYSYLIMLILSIVLSITGQLGDLVASKLKRHYMVKDAGTIFPGHGGVLDRFDSVLFTLAMAIILGIV
ncbi:MAG: phosphatidate cytidylyltransferase [Atopostipes sp.]|nr:phosphatidate cytidylyltransferase [Atopostipes sp.]